MMREKKYFITAGIVNLLSFGVMFGDAYIGHTSEAQLPGWINVILTTVGMIILFLPIATFFEGILSLFKEKEKSYIILGLLLHAPSIFLLGIFLQNMLFMPMQRLDI